jgi:hypothetical protein
MTKPESDSETTSSPDRRAQEVELEIRKTLRDAMKCAGAVAPVPRKHTA